jgi:hypothetical protein
MASERSFEDRKQKALELKGAIESFTPAYDAEDAAFSVTALDAAITAATDANTAVDDAKQPWETAVVQRQDVVTTIMPLITQSLAYVASNTAWKSRYEAVKRAADKVRGFTKKKPKTPAPTEGTGDATEKKREQGQRGFMEIAEFFRQYISRLTALAGYAPASANISLASLNALKTELDGLNISIPDLSQVLADAVRDRQEAYNNETGLHFVFKGVKAAVKGQYGQRSPEFGQVSLLQW